ncbi:MAG: RHS repeat protein [Silvibacterium sp.]|nr:RHS repeat protein [Silvibacterium sp.]
MKAFGWAVLALTFLGIGSAALADTYYYDANGRVVAIKYDNGTTVCYSYDKNGNRIAAVSGCTPPSQ